MTWQFITFLNKCNSTDIRAQQYDIHHKWYFILGRRG